MTPLRRYLDTSPYWEAARNGRLVLQRCRESGQFQHFPRPLGLATGRPDLEWREVSGSGVVRASTIIRNPEPGSSSRTPFPIAIVELDEGVRLVAEIVGDDRFDVRAGSPVTLDRQPAGFMESWPRFQLLLRNRDETGDRS